MRYIILFLLTLLNFISFGQKKEIDRSNYQLLWEISREDMPNSSYIFGTYHSNDNDVFDFPDALYTILENADAIVLETDITEMMLDKTINHYDLDFRKSDLLNWIVPARGADKVTYTAYGSDNGRPQFIDMYFKQVADNCKKTFIPLESIQDQMKIGLRNELDLNAPTNVKLLNREQLKRKYLEGNAVDLHKYTKNSTLNYINLYKDLIVDRNINMTKGIDTIIHQHASTFIAVGAAHLLGEQGIIPLLKEKGYTVKVVESEFTTPSQDQRLLKKCMYYEYKDERFGASINFTGKPATLEYGSGGSRVVRYIELGQGNTYNMGMHYYNNNTDLDSLVMSYFNEKEYQVTSLDSIMIDEHTKAYEGNIKFDGKSQWMRVFHRNNILYELYAHGGHRFMNSNRSQAFFNGFRFKDFYADHNIHLTDTIVSTSKTLKLVFPKGVFEEVKQEEYDQVWSALWFNPSNDEIYFALESIMTDNSIHYAGDTYGNYLLQDYHPDSITFTDQKHVEGAYLQKSFTIRNNGKQIHGRIRVLGNIIQFIEYAGDNEKYRTDFLKSFDSIQPFPEVQKEFKMSNNTFSTYLSKTGFRKKEVKTKYKYRNTNEYIINDTEHSITYHVLVKDFQPWAFSQKSVRELLNNQISWPNEELNAIVDTVYDSLGKHPSLNFDIYYPTSENRFIGKTMIIGKSIVVASITYPNFAHSANSKISFFDSLAFFINDSIALNTVDIPLLKNELMVNGSEGIEQLINRNHCDESTLNAILDWPINFWNSFDTEGSLRGTTLVALKNKNIEKDVLVYWKEQVTPDNFFLTIATLHILQKDRQPNDFMFVVEEARRKGVKKIDYYRYLEISKNDPEFLKSVWPIFSTLLEDSMAWSTTFIIPDLLKDEFFYSYFTSDKFIQAVISKKQPSWAAFRYLEMMYEYGVPKDLFLAVLKEWGKNKTDHKIGSIAAWKTILDEKISGKEKRMIKKDAAVAISYSKVMAVSETPVYGLLTYEDMIGYLSFDHYKDAYYDKSKSLIHMENRLLSIDGHSRSFAFYKAIENGRSYFMVRELFKNRVLPSYGGFGNDTYFIYKENTLKIDEILDELIKKVLEKEKRD